ncbi:MAG: hypothetical protein ABEH90_06760 [Halolamina sp.]
MLSYYDYVLALIPTMLVGLTGVLTLFGLPLEAALPVGSGASAAVIAHAVFVNGPVTDGRVPDASAHTGRTGNAD